MKNILINFGGFYNSSHKAAIDSMLETYFDGLPNIPDNINYNIIFNKYANNYLEDLGEYIYDNYNLEIKLHYEGLTSPVSYNFTTNKIICNLSNANTKKIISYFKKDNECSKYINEHLLPCDGFISFYEEGVAAVYDNDIIVLQNIFQCICETMNKNYFSELYYTNNRYELLYNIEGWDNVN